MKKLPATVSTSASTEFHITTSLYDLVGPMCDHILLQPSTRVEAAMCFPSHENETALILAVYPPVSCSIVFKRTPLLALYMITLPSVCPVAKYPPHGENASLKSPSGVVGPSFNIAPVSTSHSVQWQLSYELVATLYRSCSLSADRSAPALTMNCPLGDIATMYTFDVGGSSTVNPVDHTTLPVFSSMTRISLSFG